MKKLKVTKPTMNEDIVLELTRRAELVAKHAHWTDKDLGMLNNNVRFKFGICVLAPTLKRHPWMDDKYMTAAMTQADFDSRAYDYLLLDLFEHTNNSVQLRYKDEIDAVCTQTLTLNTKQKSIVAEIQTPTTIGIAAIPEVRPTLETSS